MTTSPQLISVFEVATKDNFNENGYLTANADVKSAVDTGSLKSGWAHFKRHGHKEGRKQLRDDYHTPIMKMRLKKAETIRSILKPDVDIEQTDSHVYDYRGQGRKESFGFSETANISSNSYDETPLKIIEQYPDGLILDCGAGFRPEYYENIVNYEIAPYPTTDVLGFAEDLPFGDNSFDAVFSFAVLEHVKYPFQAADEICRVLKPGGTLAVGAAFLQPMHGYPHHYFNMTNLGLQALFEDSIEIEQQFVNQGTSPIASLSWFLQEWMNNLPTDARKKFAKMRVGDFTAKTPDYYFDKNFVRKLPEAANFKLACATKMVGRKKPL